MKHKAPKGSRRKRWGLRVGALLLATVVLLLGLMFTGQPPWPRLEHDPRQKLPRAEAAQSSSPAHRIFSRMNIDWTGWHLLHNSMAGSFKRHRGEVRFARRPLWFRDVDFARRRLAPWKPMLREFWRTLRSKGCPLRCMRNETHCSSAPYILGYKASTWQARVWAQQGKIPRAVKLLRLLEGSLWKFRSRCTPFAGITVETEIWPTLAAAFAVTILEAKEPKQVRGLVRRWGRWQRASVVPLGRTFLTWMRVCFDDPLPLNPKRCFVQGFAASALRYWPLWRPTARLKPFAPKVERAFWSWLQELQVKGAQSTAPSYTQYLLWLSRAGFFTTGKLDTLGELGALQILRALGTPDFPTRLTLALHVFVSERQIFTWYRSQCIQGLWKAALRAHVLKHRPELRGDWGKPVFHPWTHDSFAGPLTPRQCDLVARAHPLMQPVLGAFRYPTSLAYQSLELVVPPQPLVPAALRKRRAPRARPK